MKNFRSAIVGCGGIAQVHARALSEMENVRLAAYADTKPERAQALASQYGGQAYASLEALLDQESIDVLHICTPHFLHLPMAQAAASRGLAVFTETPPVISRTQWQNFQALPGPVGVCFQNRFNSSVAYAQKRLEDGGLGPVLGARAFVTWRREAPYYTESGWRGALDTEGGGVLINQAIHTLDLMVRFLGPARSAQAVQANFHLPGVIQVEDTLAAYIRFAEATGVFYATTAHAVDAPILLELACQQGTLRIEGEEVTITGPDGSKERRDFAQENAAAGKAYWGSSHGRCIQAFYQSLETGGPFLNDIAGVRDTVELMLDIYQSARAKAE